MFKSYKILNLFKKLDSKVQSEVISLVHSIIALFSEEHSSLPMARYYRTEAFYHIDKSLNNIKSLLKEQRQTSDYIPVLYDVVEYVGDIERLKGKTGYIIEIPKVYIGNKEQDPKYYTRVVLLGELVGEFHTDVIRPVVKS